MKSPTLRRAVLLGLLTLGLAPTPAILAASLSNPSSRSEALQLRLVENQKRLTQMIEIEERYRKVVLLKTGAVSSLPLITAASLIGTLGLVEVSLSAPVEELVPALLYSLSAVGTSAAVGISVTAPAEAIHRSDERSEQFFAQSHFEVDQAVRSALQKLDEDVGLRDLLTPEWTRLEKMQVQIEGARAHRALLLAELELAES